MKNPNKSINDSLDEIPILFLQKSRANSLDGEVLTEITENPNYIKPTKFECKQCDYITYSKQNLDKHFATQKMDLQLKLPFRAPAILWLKQ